MDTIHNSKCDDSHGCVITEGRQKVCQIRSPQLHSCGLELLGELEYSSYSQTKICESHLVSDYFRE